MSQSIAPDEMKTWAIKSEKELFEQIEYPHRDN